MRILSNLFKTKGDSKESSAPEGQPATAGYEEELIHLSLAAIARALPQGMAGESLKSLPASVRVSFPFSLIEPQLWKGSVALPSAQFVDALPTEVRPEFHIDEQTAVALPLEEILLNLPGQGSFEAPPSQPAPPAAAIVVEKPAPAVDQHALQSLFMTEDDLDLEKIAGHIRALPGLEGCIAASGGKTASAGEIPWSFRSGDLPQTASELFGSTAGFAGRLGLGALRSQTLECGGSLVSLFVREHVCLCVFHRGLRGFLPGVREKLDAVAEQIPATA